MNFELSVRSREWLDKLNAFMAARVLPNSAAWERETRGKPTLPVAVGLKVIVCEPCPTVNDWSTLAAAA